MSFALTSLSNQPVLGSLDHSDRTGDASFATELCDVVRGTKSVGFISFHVRAEDGYPLSRLFSQILTGCRCFSQAGQNQRQLYKTDCIGVGCRNRGGCDLVEKNASDWFAVRASRPFELACVLRCLQPCIPSPDRGPREFDSSAVGPGPAQLNWRGRSHRLPRPSNQTFGGALTMNIALVIRAPSRARAEWA